MFKEGLFTYKALCPEVKYFTDMGSLARVPSLWVTNIPFTRQPRHLVLRTMQENLDDPVHPTIQKYGYQKYDNYDAIEAPSVKAIPSDYDGLVGVPLSFLRCWDPKQFEIVDTIIPTVTRLDNKGVPVELFQRLLIRKRHARTEKIES